MKMHLLINASVAMFTVSSLGACTTQSQANDIAVPTVAQALCNLGYSAIPMRTLSTGHHIVDVTIAARPATFVVDTGSGQTVIHRAYLESFGLQASEGAEETAIGAGGSTAVSRVRVKNLRIAGRRTSLDTIYTLDLSQVLKALDPIVGGPVHGIIGQDVLQAQHAIIDVQQARLYLFPLQGETRTGC